MTNDFELSDYTVTIATDKSTGVIIFEKWQNQDGETSRPNGLPAMSRWDENGRLIEHYYYLDGVYGGGNDGIAEVRYDPLTGQQIAAFVGDEGNEIEGPFPKPMI